MIRQIARVVGSIAAIPLAMFLIIVLGVGIAVAMPFACVAEIRRKAIDDGGQS